MKHILTILFTGLALTVQAQQQQPKVTSVLEVLDIETGECTVVKEFPYLIEAPNWTRDGQWLIFNSGGLIYKMDVQGKGDARLINTAYATACNNDHVLSANGKSLGISSSPSRNNYVSHVYTLPLDGGEPKLITPYGPSYLHGWSHDGKRLAYCAFRDGEQDIYTIAADGGEEEVRLTTAEGLDDGPEFSPDDRYIWFNSVRTGLMQVWRMNSDGSEQTQMTFDEDLNSWFPHISPDGKWVIYIAYHKGDLKPSEHLANKDVELRLMPAAGGTPKTLVKLFGGQGSINVNSWAPDSRHLAFVSYRLE